MIDMPPSSFDIDVSIMLNDLEFENLVYQQWFGATTVVGYINGPKGSAETILTTLEDQ